MGCTRKVDREQTIRKWNGDYGDGDIHKNRSYIHKDKNSQIEVMEKLGNKR